MTTLSTKTRVIIDTDPGRDDDIALGLRDDVEDLTGVEGGTRCGLLAPLVGICTGQVGDNHAVKALAAGGGIAAPRLVSTS